MTGPHLDGENRRPEWWTDEHGRFRLDGTLRDQPPLFATLALEHNLRVADRLGRHGGGYTHRRVEKSPSWTEPDPGFPDYVLPAASASRGNIDNLLAWLERSKPTQAPEVGPATQSALDRITAEYERLTAGMPDVDPEGHEIDPLELAEPDTLTDPGGITLDPDGKLGR